MQPPGIELDIESVRKMLRSERPDLADLRLLRFDEGYDNVVFRLGEDLAIRMPRHDEGAKLLLKERQWLPQIAPRIRFPIPVPIHNGSPNPEYPFPWAIVPWLKGTPVMGRGLGTPGMDQLIDFLSSLHSPAPKRLPESSLRGCSLKSRAGAVFQRLERLKATDARTLERVFRIGVDAPESTHSVWLHGDLHPGNVLGKGVRIGAVIDWGDLCAGDRAMDCSAIWMFGQQLTDRRRAIRKLYLSPAEIARSAGWAAFFASVFLAHPLNAESEQIGRFTTDRLARDLDDIICPVGNKSRGYPA